MSLRRSAGRSPDRWRENLQSTLGGWTYSGEAVSMRQRRCVGRCGELAVTQAGPRGGCDCGAHRRSRQGRHAAAHSSRGGADRAGPGSERGLGVGARGERLHDHRGARARAHRDGGRRRRALGDRVAGCRPRARAGDGLRRGTRWVRARHLRDATPQRRARAAGCDPGPAPAGTSAMAGSGHRLPLGAPGREARRGHSVALGTRRRSHRGARRGESERAIRLRQPRRVHHPGGVHARPLGCAHGLQRRQSHEPSALAVPRSDGAHAARARPVRPAHRHRGAVASAAAIVGHPRGIRRDRHLPRPGRRRPTLAPVLVAFAA